MNLPAPFVAGMQQLLGNETFSAFQEALQTDTPVSVRMNTAKCGRIPEAATPVAWCTSGYYLSKRPTFTFDPLFHAGGYYVQEASSMFVEQALRRWVEGPVVMLDLCAAPGGKSTLARSVLSSGSLLVANEVMRNRSQVLAENLIKWGHPGVIVTQNDPADFTDLGPVFDVILTDVPCSGEGMFRKDPVAITEWSPENVDLCVQRQRRILRDIWPALKPGGILIYSTCTYNTHENEENVHWISRELGAEVLSLEVPDSWSITGNLLGGEFPVYRFLPHRTVGEGLFLAVLRKSGDESDCMAVFPAAKTKEKRGKANRKKAAVPSFPEEVKGWLDASSDWTWMMDEGAVRAFPSAYDDLYALLKQHLRILHAGVEVCELKGRDWVPHHALALSTALCADAFVRAEISYEQAIAYLRKEAIVLDGSVPKGMVLLTYAGLPVGFVKNIGNRANNLYPQEWRIRSGYLPDEVICL